MRCESICFPRAQLLNVARQEEMSRRHEMAGAGERWWRGSRAAIRIRRVAIGWQRRFL